MDTHHLFHLGLGGGTVAGESFLDFVGGVFVNGDAVLGGDQKDDAASFGDGNAGSDVFGEKEAFDGDEIRGRLFEDDEKRLVELLETLGEWRINDGGDGTVI